MKLSQRLAQHTLALALLLALLRALPTPMAARHAFAGADWACTEVASIRLERAIFACGIGMGATEAEARIQALENAQDEFHHLCRASADCREKDVVVEPKRNSCEELPGGRYKCYRGFEFRIPEEAEIAAGRSLAGFWQGDVPQPWALGMGIGYLAATAERLPGNARFSPIGVAFSLQRRFFPRLGIFGEFGLLTAPDGLNTNSGNLVSIGVPLFLSSDPFSSWFLMPEVSWLNVRIEREQGTIRVPLRRYGAALGYTENRSASDTGWSYRVGFYQYATSYPGAAGKFAFSGAINALKRF